MGYLITAHVFREKPNFSRLAELPKSIGYRAYLHRAANLYLRLSGGQGAAVSVSDVDPVG